MLGDSLKVPVFELKEAKLKLKKNDEIVFWDGYVLQKYKN